MIVAATTGRPRRQPIVSIADAVIDEHRVGEDAGFPASSISRFGLAHAVMILIPGPIRAVSSKVKSKLACSIR